MKTLIVTTIGLVAILGHAIASAPKKPPVFQYGRLWTNSPFTVKPDVQTAAVVEANPFEDWCLGGISDINGAYLLVMLNKKKQGEKLLVEPGVPSEYQVLEVRRDPIDWKKTEVVVKHGSQTGTVTYDEKVLTASRKVAPQQNQQRPPVPGQPQVNPPQIPGQPPGTGNRPPRMRVVPPAGSPPTAATESNVTPPPPVPAMPAATPAATTTSSGSSGRHGGRFNR